MHQVGYKDLEYRQDDEVLSFAETYTNYKPSKLKIGKPHPGHIVETSTLASVEPPLVFYKLHLPDTCISSSLSDAQLEVIVYSCQRHNCFLEGGERAGYLIGDGAGVGKGRTIAGLIFENYLCNRKKSVWISVSGDLVEDAKRDLKDVGAENIKVTLINDLKYSDVDKQEISEGVLFVTYSGLIAEATTDDPIDSRFKQIVNWLGTDFDGLVVFDECHRAKNLRPVGKGKKPTKTGLAVQSLQNELKKARIVYASATGASEIKNMAYMTRLGIWGDGTAFKTFDAFVDSVERRGIGGMEIVAMDLKQRGAYMARQLSFEGVEFTVEVAKMTGDFEVMYNQAVDLWVETYEKIVRAGQMTLSDSTTRKTALAQYWASHQRFFKYLCIAAKCERAVAIAKKSIEEGKCVVIGLQSTGEARTAEQIGTEEIEDFVSSAKGVIQSLVEKYFPVPNTNRLEESSSSKRARFSEPEEEESVFRMKSDLLIKINDLGDKFPKTTLDLIIHELGGSTKVAEMTGRKSRLVMKSDGKMEYESRVDSEASVATSDQINIRERKRFMRGKKLIAIISEAASTGISLHSDFRATNQRKRVHITLELPWSADKAIQQFGRTHRSNQVVAPEYVFLMSQVAGEHRFASVVAKRLESLGALTHGDRRATESLDLSQYHVDHRYGQDALKSLMSYIQLGDSPNMPVKYPEEYKSDTVDGNFQTDAIKGFKMVGLLADCNNEDWGLPDMSKFLNRILGLHLQLQNCVFEYFSNILSNVIETAKRQGKYDMGILELGDVGKPKLMETVEFYQKHATGTGRIELHKISVARGMTWEQSLIKFNSLIGEVNGYYLSNDSVAKNRVVVLIMVEHDPSQEATDPNQLYVHVYSPSTGRQKEMEKLSFITSNYTKSTRDEAKVYWKRQFDETQDKCIHAYKSGWCRNENQGLTCDVGRRNRAYCVLSGSVLLCWLEVDSVLDLKNAKTQLVRAVLQEGVLIVGLLLPMNCHKQMKNLLQSKGSGW